MIIRGIAVATALAIGAGCASAETKLANKADYRSKQVEAIQVQRKADIMAAQAASAERVAMWNALSEAVKANPESASHMAIVAAVATSSGDSSNVVTRSNVVSLNKERETTALDWAKVLAPGIIGGVTQAGLAAIAAETQRDSIQANRDIRVQEIIADSQVWGLMNNIVDERDDDELTMADETVTETEVTVTEPNSDNNVVDDDSSDDSSEVVDDGLDSGDDTDNTDDTDDTDGIVDCSLYFFSPQPAECTS